MEQEINLGDVFKTLKKHWVLIAVTAVLTTLVAFVLSYMIITPKYQASVDILVNRKKDDGIGAQLSDQQADVNMINTYKDIITKSVVLIPVQDDLANEDGIVLSLSELESMVTVNTEQNSQVFTVDVTDTDRARAKTVANKIGAVFKLKVRDILSVNNVTIISKAKMPKAPISPNKKRNLLIGLLLGLIIGAVVAIMIDLTDHNVKDMDFLTDELGLTKLGMVSHYHARAANTRIAPIPRPIPVPVATSQQSASLNRSPKKRV
ncbi:YveK family protein [Lapidilactobacillus luobeiensis]|uniref:YveK family protein n=1 Tax=Lapidilactobacillus luobeiensis TaxID=2950371 RepID=UPI0021C3A7F0|nr:Wzz/FepE/Etk N-terminal domain-containing protein [Lapidilactobacillus luobeiensis]